ncbi:hypothetical protein GCM10022252_19970 [Streptosporangium oxazolinicum]|uniref:Uncharacterized protein n=1 Tax=Streptosporangium oxazolinicum TaxID=909287 RepID=A0ABP8ANV2_9ACTN
MSDSEALKIVLNRIKDVVYSDTFGGVFDCATCGVMVYGIDDGDWLECIVDRAFNHRCKLVEMLDQTDRGDRNAV